MVFFSQNAANVSLLFVHLRQTMIRIMTRLSVNINKIATLRNARGGDVPNVVKVALVLSLPSVTSSVSIWRKKKKA